jgi:translation initiation factor 1
MSKKKSPANGIVYSTDPAFKPSDDAVEQETLLPARQLLRVFLDNKHRGGKTVTIVSGFVGREADLESLGKQLKGFCGTGGSVKEGEVIVQGDHRAKVLQFLKGKGFLRAR